MRSTSSRISSTMWNGRIGSRISEYGNAVPEIMWADVNYMPGEKTGGEGGGREGREGARRGREGGMEGGMK